ncbi:hypothetical protein AVEN_94743-1 [Araneus ventricosus]|uniref:Uncharacterized protein n=1 Tax=Araneus ventricosus TaxID=182803 RepID=A0A4Y2CLZ9_ARAVE|nr:hypothetical protein AVEN_94743-1 [Araneus ventricosus]
MSSNTALSDLLLMYLIDFTEMQYATLICALKFFVKKEQYGTTQVLSKDTSEPLKLMLAVNLQSSEDLGRYNGYPTCPVCVSFKRGRGYRFPISTRCCTIWLRYPHDIVWYSEYRITSWGYRAIFCANRVCSNSILRAWRMWIYTSAWTVHHLRCYNAEKIMVFLWIRDFCSNKVISSVNM